MERLVRFFVERHLLVNVITAAVIVIGLSSVLRMPVEGFPSVELPQFIITAVLPGASARDVETKLTIPIEEMLAEIDGLKTYHSTATDNRSVTRVELDDDASAELILEKERDLKAELDRINDFPPEMRDRPVLIKLDPNKAPVLEIALSGPSELLAVAAKRLERRLKRAESVGSVALIGLPDPELRVHVDPQVAQGHGVTLGDVARAIERRNVSSTGGLLETAEARRQVALWGRFEHPDEVGDVIVRFDEGGAALRVRDVARLELGRKETDLVAGTNGKVGLSVAVTKVGSADIIDARNEILAAVAATELPAGVEATLVNDASFEVRNRLAILGNNGMMGGAIVAAVVFLFLAPSAAFWVCIGVPIVILGVLSLMPLFGMGINFVSTVAFVVILGLLVDDAVVVSERILLRRQAGRSPAEAAIDGATEMVRPVTAAALTTVLAFAPMFAFGGMPGRIIWQIPAVVLLALPLSLLESFVILPPHMSMVRGGGTPRPKRQFMLRLEEGYRRALRWALPRRRIVIGSYIAGFLVVMGVLAPRMEFEFIPQDSAKALFIKVSMPPGTPLEQTEAVISAVQTQLAPLMGADLLATTSRVGHQEVMSFNREYGSAGHEGLVTAYIDLGRNERSAGEWIAELRSKLWLPDEAKAVYELQLDGPPGLEPIVVHVLTNDDALRRETALAVQQYFAQIEGVVDLDIDERPGLRQIDLNPDPERLALRGLDTQDVAQALNAAYFGVIASEIRDLDETTEIRVLFDITARRSLEALLATPIRDARGELVVLRDVVEPVEQTSLGSIYHRDGLRSATVLGGIAAGSPLTAGSVVEMAEEELLPLYAGRDDLELLIGGEVEQSRRVTADVGTVLLISVTGITAVIAIMLGSFLEALFVVSILPFAAAAVILTFFAHGMHLSIFALIGSLGLAGVVVNSAIVMVDAVHRAQDAASDESDEARAATMIEAIVGRLRPITVTGLSTLGGLLPTAYGIGGYDFVMSPLSLAMGWGLALSTGVTLFLLPCLYAVGNDLNRMIDRWRARVHREEPVPLRKVG